MGENVLYPRELGEHIGGGYLPARAETVAEALQQAGYATGAFGKWGLGGPGSEGMPTKQGFDEFFGYLDQLRAHFYYPEFLFHNGERVPLEGNEVVDDPRVPGAGHPVERSTYSHDVIMEEALSFVEHHQEEPFFLYLPVTIPHASLSVPAGATSYHISYLGDLLATFAELAGAKPPKPNDSISMAPALLGREQQQEHAYLYWEFYGQASKQAVRKGQWKAVRQPMRSGEIELYDLQSDLSERRDVSAEHPEVVQQIEEIMREAHTPSPIWTTSNHD